LATDGAFEEQLDGSVAFRPLTDLHELDLVGVLDAVAADLADTSVPDELDIDPVLASCAQLSWSTPMVPSVASTEPALCASSPTA
jgi:hypothetical protein